MVKFFATHWWGWIVLIIVTNDYDQEQSYSEIENKIVTTEYRKKKLCIEPTGMIFPEHR